MAVTALRAVAAHLADLIRRRSRQSDRVAAAVRAGFVLLRA